MKLPCPYANVWNCQCKMDRVELGVGGFAVFPQSDLVLCQGLLFRFCGCYGMGMHLIDSSTSASMRVVHNYVHIRVAGHFVGGRQWFIEKSVEGVGLHCIRRIQRWLRGVLWRKRREHVLAFVMGAYDRWSPLAGLGDDVLRICSNMGFGKSSCTWHRTLSDPSSDRPAGETEARVRGTIY